MTARTKIAKTLATEIGKISVANGYKTNVATSKHFLKFWDEVVNFPSAYMSIGSEAREYHPGGFKWGFIGISLKLYVKGEYPATQLEDLLDDVERVIDLSRSLSYDVGTPGADITEIRISNIVTDEGLLEPYGVGEVNIIVQYPVL